MSNQQRRWNSYMPHNQPKPRRGAGGRWDRHPSHHQVRHDNDRNLSSYNRYGRDPSDRQNHNQSNSDYHRSYNSTSTEIHGFSNNTSIIKMEDDEPGFHPANVSEPASKKVKVEDAYDDTSRPRAERTEYLKGVNAENWFQFSTRDHFESQYPFNFESFQSIWELIENNQMIKDDRVKSKEWLDHKIEKAKELVQKYEDEFDRKYNEQQAQQNDYSSDDYSFASDEYIGGNSCRPQFDPGLKKFLLALPYNLIFDVGFHMVGLNYRDHETCFCPCSKNMAKWRANFGIENVVIDKDNCSNARFIPKGLMDHLKSIRTELHLAIREYMLLVYDDFWATNVSHKALYDVGTEQYNRAEEKFNRYFHNILQSEKRLREEESRKLEEESEKRRIAEDKLKKLQEENTAKLNQLQTANKDLYKQEVQRDSWYKVLDIDLNDSNLIGLSREEYERECHSLRGTLDLVSAASCVETHKIQLNYEMTLQDIFDYWHISAVKKTANSSGAIYFQDLDEHSKYKVFQPWDVKYDLKLKGKKADIIAVDKGGPSKVLVNTFCSQIDDLFVYLPVSKDWRMKDISRPSEIEYLEPGIGWRVKFHKKGTKKSSSTEGRIVTYDRLLNKATIKELGTISVTVIEMNRHEFQVTGIPIRLFEPGSVPCRDGIFQMYEVERFRSDEIHDQVDDLNIGPAEKWRRLTALGLPRKEVMRRFQLWQKEKNENFLSQQSRDSSHLSSKINDQLWSKIRKFNVDAIRSDIERKVEISMESYYRAYGRMILHIMFDSRLSLSQKVMPKFFRNVLLRGIKPQSDAYSSKELVDDLLSMKALSSSDEDVIGKTFEVFFTDLYEDVDVFIRHCDKRVSPWKHGSYNVDAKDEITKENFKTVFVPLYVLETRFKAINSILDGLTLNNRIKIHAFFDHRPLEVFDGSLFSGTSFSVQDVTDLLCVNCDYKGLESESLEKIVDSHSKFLKDLKMAIHELSEEHSMYKQISKAKEISSSTKSSSFLVDFLYFMTGMEYLPSLQAIPDFKLWIEFEFEGDQEILPTGHTCHNTITFPSTVYGNNYEMIKHKLCLAVRYGKGFGME